MNLTDCYYLGYFSRVSHNTNKAVLKLDTDNPEKYLELESILVQMHASDQSPIPFFVKKAGPLRGQELNLELEIGQQLPEISVLKGKSVFLPLSQLEPLGEKGFYFHEIIGFEVQDASKGLVGTISDVYDNTAHPVLAINHQGKEVLIPANDEILVKIDKVNRKIFISAPEGLIDLYLD
jgi:16S rRNA processing protein RimM